MGGCISAYKHHFTCKSLLTQESSHQEFVPQVVPDWKLIVSLKGRFRPPPCRLAEVFQSLESFWSLTDGSNL